MKPESATYGRRSIRLRGNDYRSTGAYFVTICAKNRKCMFGDIVHEEIRVSEGGNIVDECWRNIPMRYPSVFLDHYIIMPNHVHGVIFIDNDDVGVQNFEPLQRQVIRENKFQQIIPKSVGSIVRGF